MSGFRADWPIGELAKLEVVALGCHRTLHGELTRFFNDKHGIEVFQLVEYFLRKPLQRSDTPAGNEVCFPYLRRLFENNAFQSREEDGRLCVIPRTRSLREGVEIEKIGDEYRPRRYVVPFDEVVFGQSVFDAWASEPHFNSMTPREWFQTNGLAEWKEYERRISVASPESRSVLLVELDLVVRFWKNCSDGIRTIVGG